MLSNFTFYILHSAYLRTYITAFDSVVMAISEAGGLNAIEELQNHPNQNIYQRAVKMLEVSTYVRTCARTYLDSFFQPFLHIIHQYYLSSLS